MISEILGTVTGFIINLISSFGYLGIVFLMGIESANIPLPSEIIMPFSGFLVAQGRFDLWIVGLAGAIGCLLGSVVSYWLGAIGGRPLISRYGKYILFSHRDLEIADRWFLKYGEVTVFFSRLLPIVRTFISFPAGIAKMNFPRFVIYTFLGSLPWTLALAWVGKILGENWEKIKDYFKGFDILITFLVILLIILWIRRHLKNL